MNIRYLLMISVCLTISGCQEQVAPTQNTIIDGYDIDHYYKESCFLYMSSAALIESGTTIFKTELSVRVYNNQALTIDDFEKTGYCFTITYYPDNTTTKYKKELEYGLQFPLRFGPFYQEGTMDIHRYGDGDRVVVTVNNSSEEYSIPCAPFVVLTHEINISRPETYDCIFKGIVRGTHLNLSQLDEMACESYPVSCS